MPKVSREHQEDRKSQIIDAARRCFARKGFHQASMQDIVAESGLSPGAIYLYFRSKDEIIRATADIRHENERRLFAEILSGCGAHTALSRIARHFFDSLKRPDVREERRLDVQLWGEAMVNPAVRAVEAEGVAETARVLAEAARSFQAQGGLAPELPPENVARVMLALFQGFVLQQQLDGGLDAEGYIRVVQALIDSHFEQNGEGARDESGNL